MTDEKLSTTSLTPMRGAGGGGKSSGGGSTFTRTPDTLRSADTVEIILGLGEGEWVGLKNGAKSFYAGDTPLQNPDNSKNFEYFDVLFRPGLPEVSADYLIPKLGGTSNNQSVNTSLAQNVAVTRQMTQNNIDAIDLRLAVAQLFRQDDNGTYTHTLSLRIEIKKDTDPSWGAAFASLDVPISGKTTSTYVKELRIPVPRVANFWQVRITKLSNNTNANEATDVAWESYQMITQELKKYPDTATLQIVAKSTNQFSSIPDFWGIYETKKIKLPSNYNPVTRAYTGAWDGTFQVAFSDNPAWCLYDFVMSTRYGMSATWPVNADKYEFYEAGKWTDQFVNNGSGGTEPRYTFNGVISEPQSAVETARYIAGMFNAAIFDDNNGNIILRCDRDDTPATHLFTPENIGEEGFQYSFTDVNSWYNDITVSFINPDLNWNEDRRRVSNQTYITKYGRVPLDFVAVGCNKQSEALRRANYKLITANTEKQIVNFTTNRLGGIVQPFEVVLVADPTAGYALSGRVKSINAGRTVVTLRDPVYLEVGITYTATFRVQTGLITRTLTVGASGSVTQFTVNSALPSDFPEDCTFSLERSAGVGIGAPKPFRVMSVDEVDGNPDGVKITAIELNRNKFNDADQGIAPTVIQYSGLGDPNSIPGPTNVVFTDRYSLIGNEVWTILTVTLPKTTYRFYTDEFRVFSRPIVSGNPVGAFEERAVMYGDTLVNHPEGEHEFKILPLNSFGFSPPLASMPSWTHDVSSAGAAGTPPDPVEDVEYQLTPTGFVVRWKPPTGQETVVHHYMVKEGLTEGTATIIADNLKDPIFVVDIMTKRTYNLYIYAVSLAGVPSTAVTQSITNAQPQPPANIRAEVGYETVMVFYDRNAEIDIVGYRIRFRKVGDVPWLDMDPNGLFDQADPDTAYEFSVAALDALTVILDDPIWSTPRSVRTRPTIGVAEGIDEIRQSTTQNLVRNGSFERGNNNWTFNGATIVDDDSAPHSDLVTGTTKVLQIGDGVAANATALSDTFTVRPGWYYALSADFLADADDPGESHIFTLRVFDQNNTMITDFNEETGKLFIEPDEIDTVAWTRLSTKMLMPASAVKAQVFAESRGTGKLYMDGVQAQRGPVATAFNPHVAEELSPQDLGLISNPDNTPPSAPTLLQAIGSFKSVIATWSPSPETDVARYEILRSQTNQLSSATVVGTAVAPVFVDSGLVTGLVYYYWVRAVDTSGNKSPANAGQNGGTPAQTLALTSADYQDLSIVNAKIANAAIDDAKIGSVSAGKITTGTLTAADIYLGSSNFLLTASGRFLGVADDNGFTRVLIGKLGAGAFNYGIQVYSQTGALILGANGLGLNVVGTDQLLTNAVTGDKIVVNAIDATKIAANSITAVKIAASAVESAKIAAGAVTADKISVATLSAITANIGTVTAGLIRADGLSAVYNYWNLDTGAFSVGRADGAEYIRFNPTTGKVEIKGDVIFTSGGGGSTDWADITNKPTSLGGINAAEGDKLAGIEDGADVTGNNTSNNTSNVGSLTAAQINALTLDPAAQINQVATTISGAKITTGTITANKLNVATLAAISANIGTVTAGLLRNGANTAYVNLDASGGEDFININNAFRVTANGQMFATAGSISGDLLVDGTVTAGKLGNNSISEFNIGTNGVNVNIAANEKLLVWVNYFQNGIPAWYPLTNFVQAMVVCTHTANDAQQATVSNIIGNGLGGFIGSLPPGNYTLRVFWYVNMRFNLNPPAWWWVHFPYLQSFNVGVGAYLGSVTPSYTIMYLKLKK